MNARQPALLKRLPERQWICGIWTLCLAVALVSLGGCNTTPDEGGGEGEDPGQIGADCDTDNPCALGLVCGSGGECEAGGGEGDGPPPAASFFVSPGGDDQADGLTAGSAFGTIARGVAAIGPGDTLAIMPGTYNEAILVDGFGDASATITIRGEDGIATFDGQRTKDVGFYCIECTNVVFENLEFTNYTDIGIMVNLSQDVTVRNLIVHDNGFAAGTGVDMEWAEGYGIHADDSIRITIEDNDVYRNGPNPQVLGRLMGTGINTFNLTDSVIRNNHSYENIGGGILVEDSTRVLVEGNEINDNDLDATVEEWWDGGVWIDGGSDITLRNNNIHDNLGPGVEISDEDNQNPSGYILENNTITGNTFGLFIWNFGTSELPASDILELIGNNIGDNTDQEMWIVPWIEETPD